MRDRTERGGFLRKALRVEHELAPAVLRLHELRLGDLVPLEVLAAVVDHDSLVLYQGETLYPGPLKRLSRTAALNLLLFGATLGGSLFGVDDPVDG